MSAESLTLRSFFADGETLAVRGAEVLAGVADRLPGGEGLAKAIEGALDQAFDVELGDVLLASWEQADALTKALTDDSKDEVVVLPLLDHTVASTHSPTIDLFCGAKRLAELPLEIQLDLQLKGLALELKGGKVTGVRSGEISGHGACTIGGVALVEKETPPMALPGRLAFGKPPSSRP